MNKASVSIQKTGQQAQNLDSSLNKASSSIQRIGQQAQKTTADIKGMAFGVAALGTSAATTFTSLSNLDKAAQRLEKSTIGVKRAEDLLTTTQNSVARLQLKLNKMRDTGKSGSEEFRLAEEKLTIQTGKLSTALEDLTVKQREVEIQTGALADTQINMAVSIGNTVLFSIFTLTSVLQANQKTWIATRVQMLLANTTFKSLIFNVDAFKTAMVGATFSLTGLRTGVKAFFTALGPVGLAIIGIGIAMEVWNSNMFGVQERFTELWNWLKKLIPVLQVLESLSKSIFPEAAADVQLFDNALQNSNKTIDTFDTNLQTSVNGMNQFTSSIVSSNKALENHNQLLMSAKKHDLNFKKKLLIP